MTRRRSCILAFAALAAAVALGAGEAAAQTVETSQPPEEDSIDRIERVAGLPQGGFGRAEGVRRVKPAALMFASYDTNHDAIITRAEIDAGAAASFIVADKNKDGVLSGFEQSDWASLIAAADDVVSNPMQFDTDLDRSVTQTEFIEGIRRLAQQVADPATGNIAFTALIQPLSAQALQAERGGPPPRGAVVARTPEGQ
jgi:hypothetical protein